MTRILHETAAQKIIKSGLIGRSHGWLHTGEMSSKSSTRMLPWMMTRCSSTIRTTISPTSRKPRTRTPDNSVFPQCLNPLFCTFLMMILLFKEKAKKACNRETVARQRKEREGSVISVAESMSRKSRQNSTRGHSLQSRKEFYSDERDLGEHLQRRAQQAVHGKTSAQRKLHLTQYDMEIQILERRNSEYALFESQRELESQRQQLLEASEWAEQAQREKIHLCSRYTRSCREIEELKKTLFQEENIEKKKTTKIGIISYAA